MNPHIFYLSLALLLTVGLIDASAVARDAAGKVAYVKGEAWVQVGAARNPLETGAVFFTGDEIHTGAESNLYLRFRDRTLFTLGPEARMTVDSYDESDAAVTSFATSILRGAFRFVSGLLAREKPKRYRVRVTVGTIGVRGTTVAGEVFERRESDAGLIEASAKIVLLEDEEERNSSIEVFNEYGSVIIDQPGFGTEIPDETSPPSPARRMQVRSVNTLLRAIRNTVRSNTQRRTLR